jgi:hypothetical protein
MAMSCKDVVLICLVVGALVLASLGRQFFREVWFVMDHLIAAAIAHTPLFLHFVSALVR